MAVLVLSLATGHFAGSVPAQEKIPPQPVTGKIAWLYDYATGKQAARESGKPMFVVFRCER
jgi:hypothetical protein